MSKYHTQYDSRSCDILVFVQLAIISSCYLLGHSSYRARDRGQVVTAEVDFCQGGDITDGKRELTEMIVGQVEAPQTGKSAKRQGTAM